MKRRLLVLLFTLSALLALDAGETKAQSTELGIIFGEPTGLSAKFWTGGRSAVGLGAAWSLGGSGSMHVHADYLLHYWMQGVTSLYVGMGARTIIQDDPEIAARVPLGLQLNAAGNRLAFFLELAPTLPLIPESGSGFDVNGGVGMRFRF
jgi:hypothetical protein